jgi:hypothetical protein
LPIKRPVVLTEFRVWGFAKQQPRKAKKQMMAKKPIGKKLFDVFQSILRPKQ